MQSKLILSQQERLELAHRYWIELEHQTNGVFSATLFEKGYEQAWYSAARSGRKRAIQACLTGFGKELGMELPVFLVNQPSMTEYHYHIRISSNLIRSVYTAELIDSTQNIGACCIAGDRARAITTCLQSAGLDPLRNNMPVLDVFWLIQS